MFRLYRAALLLHSREAEVYRIAAAKVKAEAEAKAMAKARERGAREAREAYSVRAASAQAKNGSDRAVLEEGEEEEGGERGGESRARRPRRSSTDFSSASQAGEPTPTLRLRPVLKLSRGQGVDQGPGSRQRG